jgi:hypothetical protein
LDELDKGWSISRQNKYINVLNVMTKGNSTVILISHNPVLLYQLDNVLDMSHKKWVKPLDYFLNIDKFRLGIIKHLVKLKDIDKEINNLFLKICIIDFSLETITYFYNQLLSTITNKKKYSEHIDTTFKPLIDYLLDNFSLVINH